MADMDQLSSMLLSQIAIDDSSLPIVHYGTHMPIAARTPTGTDVHVHSSQQEDSYQQIIPGIPQGLLYPTLSSLSSRAVASDTDVQSLHAKVTKGLNKYLQDAEQLHVLEVNYFDDTARLVVHHLCQKPQNRSMNLLRIIYPQLNKSLLKR